MLNWDEYNKDEAAVVQQEAMTAKPVVQEAVAEAPEVKEAPLSMLIPTWIMLGASLFFGIMTDTTAGVALEAARQLMGAP